MKLKKGILLIVFTLIALSIIGTASNVQAAIISSKTLNLKTMGYQVNEKTVYRIYVDGHDRNESFYCLKGGPGFSSGDMGIGGIAATEYTNGTGIDSNIGDLRYPIQIDSKYTSALPTDTSKYTALMWILDQCYVPAKTNVDGEVERASENKAILLAAVEEYVANWTRQHGDNPRYENTSDYEANLMDNIEESDIILVQQLAIWHYTNTDGYHHEQMPAFNADSSVGGPLTNDDEDTARIHAMNALFDYLVQTPKQSGFSYDYTKNGNTSKPAQFATTTTTITTSESKTIVGPYRLEKGNNDASYSLDYTIKDGSNNTLSATFTDASGNALSGISNIKDLVGEGDFYISIPSTADTSNIQFSISGSFMTTTLTYWSEPTVTSTSQPVVQIEKENQTFDDEKNVQKEPDKKFDLALRKFITSINEVKLTGEDSREPKITTEALRKLANGETLTAEKTHPKDAITIKTGDTVIYTIRVYNEGEIDGWATQVTDYLPAGLELVPASESEINSKYGWSNPSGDKKTIVTDYLASNEHKLTAFNKETLALDYEDLEIECKVVATVSDTDQSLKNIAEITANKDINGNTGYIDLDSKPGNVTINPYNPKDPTKGMGEEDDDDFEQLILPGKYFDLSLRKFIASVTDSAGKPRTILSREPVVDTTPLLNGSDTTAIYNHAKQPVSVTNGDIVIYTIRVYNEGPTDGYVTEITDHLPTQLEFINDEFNAKYGWTISADGRTVTTDITSPETESSGNRDIIYADRRDGEDKVLLKAFSKTEDAELDYIDVQIKCKVKENIDLYEKITNIAEITGFTDSEGVIIKDRDSQEDNVTLPKDETLPTYKDPDIESGKSYIEGQQDDDDFEKLVLQRFDLSLKKFITEVKNADGSNVQTITHRVPAFELVDGKPTYTHTKEPVEVANSNIVTYTLRIFNEGNVEGYATKVKDDIPEGLEFLPEDATNTAFGWKMYKEDGTETKEVAEASYIETDFLSKEKEKEEGDNLLGAFNPETMTMPDYKDIKVAFKVVEPNTSDRIIINTAEITEDSDKEGNQVDDIDSIPDNNKEGEDDIDIEKIKVKYFDLSLKKWVTESIVTYKGKTTTTKSGHTGDENPEAPMKVEIQNDKINKTTVKFRFNIKVTNEGEIPGYATEIIDYIPDGLKFVAKDNPKWTVSDDGKVTTDQLKDKLLQPGESATVDIVLTWINGKDNMGQKVNWAEISKDKNEYNSPDIDSIPGNNVKGEDDIDQAPVLLSPATGSIETYMTLTLSCVAIIAGGVLIIKKFVI